VRDPVPINGVFQRADHVVLPDDVVKRLRAPLARDNLVGAGHVEGQKSEVRKTEKRA
jgi:hypothetical protein